MRQTSYNRAKTKLRQRKLRRDRLKRQRSSRILPCGNAGWKDSIKTMGGAAGGLAGFIEFVLIVCAI